MEGDTDDTEILPIEWLGLVDFPGIRSVCISLCAFLSFALVQYENDWT